MHGLLRQRALCVLVAGSSLLLSAAIAQTPSQPAESAESHIGKGYEALKQDRYTTAADEFRAALALDPSQVLRAEFPLAVALFEEHKSAEARHEFEEVRKKTGQHPNVAYYLGRLDVEDLKFAEAIKNLTVAAEKPPFPDTAYYLGFAYLKQGDLVHAEKWLKQALESTPRDSRVPYQLGIVYRKQGREEEAKKSLGLSAELRRQDDSEAQLRTECSEKLKSNREEAHAVCDQLYHDDDADRLTELGMIYAKSGDFEAALKPLRRAAELAPQSPQVQYNLALTFFQMSRFEEARAPLELALKRWPDLFPLNALFGAVLLKLNQEEQAYDVLRHAHELNPQDSGTSDSLYFLSLKLADESETAHQDSNAIIYWNEAARLRPSEAEPHSKLADVYKRLGKSSQAQAERSAAERLGAK